jgi:uncharacterized OB-fold protein
MATEYAKALPPITTLTTSPFWEGTRQHILKAYKCQNCGNYYWPAIDCMKCDHPTMEWVEVTGQGEIYSFIIMHHIYHPAWKDEVPYNICWIELDEGPLLISSVVGCNNSDLYIGMRVEAVFDEVTSEVTLPRFKPITV